MFGVRSEPGVRPWLPGHSSYTPDNSRPDISDQVDLMMTAGCNPEQDPHPRHRSGKSVRSPPEIFQIERTMHVMMPKNKFHSLNGFELSARRSGVAFPGGTFDVLGGKPVHLSQISLVAHHR